MAVKPTFEPIRVANDELTKVQNRLKETFDAFLNYLAPTFVVVSFVAQGLANPGFLPLPANRNLDGSIRRQALRGAKLVAALQINGASAVVDQQTVFEPILSFAGQIHQLGSFIGGPTIAFILTQPTLK